MQRLKLQLACHSTRSALQFLSLVLRELREFVAAVGPELAKHLHAGPVDWQVAAPVSGAV
jgi:hypothetical protein